MKRKAKLQSDHTPREEVGSALFTAAWRDLRTWLCGLLLAAVVFGIHARDLGNGFVYDDEDNIVNNPHYRGLGLPQISWMFTTFHMGHYQPLSWATLGLDYVLWGNNPVGYHLTNLVLHAANAVLVYLLALALLGGRAASAPQRPGLVTHAVAVVAALLFAAHPLRVESVAWVTERRDVLSSFFLLLAALFYLHAHGGAGVTRPTRWIGMSLAVYALSLLSRALGVTFPAVLLLLDWYPLRRIGGPRGWTGRAVWRVCAEKIPFALLALIFVIVAPIAARSSGASATLAEHGFLERTAQACYGLVFYLWKTVLPFKLAPLYEIPPVMVLQSTHYIVPAVLVFLAVLAGLIWGRRWPWLTVVALLHVVLLGPVLGFLQAGPQEVADRYSYLPAVGWAILVGAALLWLWQRPRLRPAAVACIGLSVLSIVGLGALTSQQSLVWRTSTALWEQAVRAAPCATAHQNLGASYARTSRLPDAILQYRAALQIEPLNKPSQQGLAKALTDTNQFDDAAQAWDRFLQYTPNNARAHFLFANVQRARGKPDEAVQQYTEALRLEPGMTDARLGLAGLLAERGKMDEAAAECRQVLASEPEQPMAHYILGNTLAAQRRFDEAVAEYRRALAARADFPEASGNLAIALEFLGRREEAVQIYRTMLGRYPDQLVARYNLATALAKLGRRDEAITELREVLKRNPNHAPARRTLDALLAPAAGGG
jgi:tetratricopeptide (TPR) repeat protein